MARKSTCALVAVPGVGFSFSSSSIALMPKGVAALPRPSMLAAMLSSIAEIGRMSVGHAGKERPEEGPHRAGELVDEARLLGDL